MLSPFLIDGYWSLETEAIPKEIQNAVQASRQPEVSEMRQVRIRGRGESGRRSQISQNVLQVWYVEK